MSLEIIIFTWLAAAHATSTFIFMLKEIVDVVEQVCGGAGH